MRRCGWRCSCTSSSSTRTCTCVQTAAAPLSPLPLNTQVLGALRLAVQLYQQQQHPHMDMCFTAAAPLSPLHLNTQVLEVLRLAVQLYHQQQRQQQGTAPGQQGAMSREGGDGVTDRLQVYGEGVWCGVGNVGSGVMGREGGPLAGDGVTERLQLRGVWGRVRRPCSAPLRGALTLTPTRAARLRSPVLACLWSRTWPLAPFIRLLASRDTDPLCPRLPTHTRTAPERPAWLLAAPSTPRRLRAPVLTAPSLHFALHCFL